MMAPAAPRGSLCESFDFMKANPKRLTTKDRKTLQERTFYGKEKEVPRLRHRDHEHDPARHRSAEHHSHQHAHRKPRRHSGKRPFDVVLANPPFGGKERKEVQQNFPIRTGETAFLFLQHFIKMLKAGGRGGVVIKNTFLSNTDNASVSLRKLLLGKLQPAHRARLPRRHVSRRGREDGGAVLREGRAHPQNLVYQLDPGRNLGKTNPLNDDDLAEFVKLQKTFADSPKSWSVDAKTIDQTTFDLSVKNPNGGEEIKHRSPRIMEEIAALDAESAEVLGNIKATAMKKGWQKKDQGAGTTMTHVSMGSMNDRDIHVPTLAEQQRIVGILDKAFDGIATAKANAEKNLQNARALFESYLDYDGAETALLGDIINITTGKLDANAAVEGGKYSFFTCSREIYAIDDYAFDCEAILLAGNNAVGDFNVKHFRGKFNAYQRTYVITVNEQKRVLYRFLYFQVLKSLKKFKAQSVGTGTKFLKLAMIKDLEIALPSLVEQARIVATMDSLREQTENLETIYHKKLVVLEELKKSLLHQAFAGEL
jgi:hypothetical protein